MKLTIILIVVAVLQVSANGYSQTVTISFKNTALQKVLFEIEKQTGYTFLYTDQMMEKVKPVDISVNKESLQTTLELCFANQPLGFTILNKTIILKPKEPLSQVSGLGTEQEATSTIDVKGKIVNESGDPVAASIIVKGTQQGATTNERGEFEIKAVDENATLIITGISIEKFEVKLNGKRSVFYTAKTKVTGMQEVIVNKGYYTEKQKLSVSNTVSITAKDIEKQPVQNVLLAMQARVPGLFITQNSGNAGGSVKIRIQGDNSINSGNDPLYVVDGVPIDHQLPRTGIDYILGNGGPNGFAGWGNPLNYLNPLDIESVEVLKDADATAIYGSRAANGAILITTKKGKAGEMKFDFNMETGWGKMNRRMDMMNTRQYLDMRYEAFANDGINWRDHSVSAIDLKLWDTTSYTNWQDVLLGGTAQYNNINASISGGSNTIRYLVSGRYHKETTILPLPNDFADQKASVHFNINANNNNQKFRMQFSGNYMFDNNQLPQTDMTQAAVLLEPNAPALLNADGSINWAPDAAGNSTLDDLANPMVQKHLKYVNKTYNLVSNLKLDYTILPGLNISSSVGYNYMQTNDFSPSPLIAVAPELRATRLRGAAFGSRNIQSWIIEPQASYRTKINKGTLDLLIGSTFQNKNAVANSISGTGQLNDQLLDNIQAAVTVTKGVGSSVSNYRYNALFGRANYNWDDKYIISMNARRDGSTRFGADNRFHNFGSIGAAWLFSNEGFFKKTFDFISFGKLKGNYGTTGNDQIGDYQFMSLYSLGNASVPYQGIVGLLPSGLPNPNLQWEETQKLLLGIDLGFLKDRVALNANYVRNRSSNQLLGYNLPSPAGYTGYTVNFPATVQNRNWEFMLTGKIVQQKNFSWSSSINFTLPQNKLIAFPGLSTSTYANTLVIGQPIDISPRYHWVGVGAGTGDNLYADRNGHLTLTPGVGEDRTILISRFPKFYGGFDNTIIYKNIQLSFIFQFVKQIGYNDVTFWNGSRYPGMFTAANSNQPVTVLDRWQNPGDINKSVGRYSTYEVPYINDSDHRFTDASYISLKNVSLSCDLPKKWTDKARFRNFRLYMHGQNLLMLTNYKGLNPETQSVWSLPALTTWTVGIQAGL